VYCSDARAVSGASGFEAVGELLRPSLPLDQGDRIVAVQLPTNLEKAGAWRVIDDALWRDQLRSIEQLSAFRTTQLNLVTASALPEPIKVAEITASGLAVGRTPPHLGRYLLTADETSTAEAVMVLGYDAWSARFGSDPRIVGRMVRLGGVPRTVVGVMPKGFRFPGTAPLSVLLLCAAGIYALMSFTVAQRTREIGIRTALGAHPHRVLAGAFARSIRQLLMGVLAGSAIPSWRFRRLDSAEQRPRHCWPRSPC
jgi:hypothetical protein